jgi:thymidine phosphorylase
MLVLGGVEEEHGAALERCEEALDSGAALERLVKVVELQGGDPRAIEDTGRLPLGEHALDVRAGEGGYVAGLDAMAIGRATVALGAGRLRSEDDVDPGAGVIMHRKPGDAVEAGERLATLHASDASRLEPAAEHARAGYVVGAEPPAGGITLIMEEIGS